MPDLSRLREAAEAAHTARLSAAVAEQELRRVLREARGRGVPVVEMAAALGVSRQRVYQLLR